MHNESGPLKRSMCTGDFIAEGEDPGIIVTFNARTRDCMTRRFMEAAVSCIGGFSIGSISRREIT